MWLKSPNISCIHGFSTRHGGVSPSPFSSLNLGGSDDEIINVTKNRERALAHLHLDAGNLFTLKQVHGDKVCEAVAARQEGDALVSATPGNTIAVLVADCYPVLFYDEKHKVIGAAHCGWRGTLAGIAAKTLAEMEKLGAEPGHVSVAIGQGISQENFEVGEEVITAFREKGFPENCWEGRKIDLIKCILFTLKSAGLSRQQVWTMNRCTFEEDFFSYRRDKGKTGRMMGLISLPK